MTINYSHDRVRYGKFPKDKLENIDGLEIKVSVERTDKPFIDKVIIDIELLNEDKGNEFNIAFQLGMLVEQFLINL